ncbi:methionine ABC transporter ATP-binding protein [Vibrio sp. qd031]|uniref:ABC transporter ATP-binding protein n=1 Tax=Vibrio sp. qd031 TaxID=1603038 RepID=UPI000A101C88|nr:ABC transporter ATP-binding protein [Vibrio sp. qd031]ORT48187.1 methionine ABC transporter ATP-binding protein [Vibrio sp. qd031]
MSHTIISLTDVEFRWQAEQAPTLQIESLNVVAGEHLFIKGPSGCGKSTLLGLLTGINIAQQGQVQVLDCSLSELSQSKRDKFRADHLGYIFQQFNLLPYLSVIENVVLPCRFSSKRKQAVEGAPEKQAEHLLDRLHLPKGLLNKPVIELSIGQQQRVAAARALIGQPELIIADEPTSALDFNNRTAFIELLMEEAEQSKSTLVFVSHDPTLESLFKRTINLETLNRASATV